MMVVQWIITIPGAAFVLDEDVAGGVGVVERSSVDVEDGGGAPLMIIAPPEGAAETCCPSIVVSDPGMRVKEPIMKFDEKSWVMVWLPKRTGAGGGIVVDSSSDVLVASGDEIEVSVRVGTEEGSVVLGEGSGERIWV